MSNCGMENIDDTSLLQEGIYKWVTDICNNRDNCYDCTIAQALSSEVIDMDPDVDIYQHCYSNITLLESIDMLTTKLLR